MTDEYGKEAENRRTPLSSHLRPLSPLWPITMPSSLIASINLQSSGFKH